MFRKHNSPAMVVAIVALIAALGGTAVAGALITGAQIKNSSITGKDVKNKSLTKKDFKGSIRGKTGPAGPAGAVGPAGPAGPQGPAGTPDGYTKTEADAAFLGKTAKAADAEKVDGVDSDDLVAGDAAVGFNTVDRDGNTAIVDLLTLPDIGMLRVQCQNVGNKSVYVKNTSANVLQFTAGSLIDGASGDLFDSTITVDEDQQIQGEDNDYQVTIQILRPTVQLAGPTDFTTVIVSATDDGTDCQFKAHAVTSEYDGGLQIAP